MARQRESVRVVDPFKKFLKHQMGWEVYNIHGNMYQAGYPDCYITHENYTPRWVEFKVVEDSGSIKLTDAQKKKFPKMIAHNVPIYIIAHKDLRGNINEIRRMYRKLFEEPNAMFAFSRRTWSMLY